MTVFWAWTRFGVAALLAAALAGPVLAAPESEAGRAGVERPGAMRRLVDCRKLADNVARLACYDEATAALDQAEAKGDIVVVDREQARKVRRQAFGFALPSLSLFDRGEKPEELDRVTLPIQRAARGSDGRWIVQVDGQVWRQIDSEQFSREPREGRAATIRKAMLGSYMMSVDGHPGGRVTRDK